MSKQTMGEFLALLRKANGYTQQDVAEKLNISNRTLSSWETDRTTPDILLLPSIADLYGVTVDELLRCERNQAGGESKEFSDKAILSKRKHRLGKFSALSLLLSCLGCLGATVLALSFIIALYTYCPTWLFALLVALSACDIVVCGILQFYYCYNSKVSEGLVIKEDYTEETKAYALAIQRKSAKYFLFCGVPLLLCAIGLLIAAIVINPQNREITEGIITVYTHDRDLYIAFISVAGSLGIAFLIAYGVYSNVCFTRFANETQTATFKNNAKLLGKTTGFGIIPLAVIAALLLIFVFVEPVTYHTWISADTKEDFKKQMQTLTVDENHWFHSECDKPVGEYYLDFPEEYEYNTVYDLGNGFCGIYDYSHWDVLVLKDATKLPVSDEYGELDDYSLIYSVHITCDEYSDVGFNYVNVSYNASVYNETVFGLRIDSVLKGRCNNGKYEFGTENTCNLAFTFIYLFLIAAGVSVITCTAIYLSKRKKQNYKM